jgi:hypothetical protein
VLVYGYYVFQNPPYMASRQLLIPRIAVVGTSFIPLPCQAWHGYMVTSAHRVEVEAGTDGHASASPSRAAAAAPPAGANTISSFQNSPPYMALWRRIILRIAAASPSRFSACDRPPPRAMSCPTPREGSTGTWLVDAERALFHGDASRLLQPMCPTGDPAVPSSPSNAPTVHAPPLKLEMYLEASNHEKHIGRAEREILAPVLHINCFIQKPYVHGFPATVDPADRVVGPLSPLPCQAWHGYGVSSAHHGEVRGCRRA